MIAGFKSFLKSVSFRIRVFLVATAGKRLIQLLFKTCRVKAEGLENFLEIANNEPCIIMLWHNRLTMAPSILERFTPSNLTFAAMVSGSRDGILLKSIVESYKRGRSIRVGHQARYSALRELVRHIEEGKHITVITPDGPRGPRYQMKPGIAVAALETRAKVIALNWESKRYWQLKTWDGLRFPKPFTTITVSFTVAPEFNRSPPPELEEALTILRASLPDV